MSACNVNTALLVVVVLIELTPLVAFWWWLRRVSRQAEWRPPEG